MGHQLPPWPATEKQLKFCNDLGYPKHEREGITASQAKQMIEARKDELAAFKEKHGEGWITGNQKDRIEELHSEFPEDCVTKSQATQFIKETMAAQGKDPSTLPPTESQLNLLKTRFKHDIENDAPKSKAAASELITQYQQRSRKASPGQIKFLTKLAQEAGAPLSEAAIAALTVAAADVLIKQFLSKKGRGNRTPGTPFNPFGRPPFDPDHDGCDGGSGGGFPGTGGCGIKCG